MERTYTTVAERMANSAQDNIDEIVKQTLAKMQLEKKGEESLPQEEQAQEEVLSK